MTHPDIVYIVGPNRHAPDRNAELRYSLRSLANVPHNKVWIVGQKPDWVINVGYIPTEQKQDKYQNAYRNTMAATLSVDIADDFLLFNDDMFAMQPMASVPPKHRGPVREVVADYKQRSRLGGYLSGMESTAALLASIGFSDPLSYELHIPMPVNKHRLRETLITYQFLIGGTRRSAMLHKRTWYGNMQRIGGEYHEDVKVFHPRQTPDQWLHSAWLSTGDNSWCKHEVGVHIRTVFNKPSPYEKAV